VCEEAAGSYRPKAEVLRNFHSEAPATTCDLNESNYMYGMAFQRKVCMVFQRKAADVCMAFQRKLTREESTNVWRSSGRFPTGMVFQRG